MSTREETAIRQAKKQPSANALAGLAAMKRAAVKARRRAIALTGSVAVWKDGKVVYETEV